MRLLRFGTAALPAGNYSLEDGAESSADLDVPLLGGGVWQYEAPVPPRLPIELEYTATVAGPYAERVINIWRGKVGEVDKLVRDDGAWAWARLLSATLEWNYYSNGAELELTFSRLSYWHGRKRVYTNTSKWPGEGYILCTGLNQGSMEVTAIVATLEVLPEKPGGGTNGTVRLVALTDWIGGTYDYYSRIEWQDNLAPLIPKGSSGSGYYGLRIDTGRREVVKLGNDGSEYLDWSHITIKKLNKGAWARIPVGDGQRNLRLGWTGVSSEVWCTGSIEYYEVWP
jgi:hypothetical protein